jgi:hypothetical protein
MSGPGTAATPQRRLSATFGPEIVAGLLSVAVIVGAGSFVVATATAPSTPSTPVPSVIASSAPSPLASPGTSAPATLVPWAGEARSLIATDDRLVVMRERLQAELAGNPVRAREIAQLLRTMNPTLTNALAIIDRLEVAGVKAALVTSLRTAHQDAMEASLDALDAAIDNTQAYAVGAARVIEAFDRLETLSERLRAEANLPAASPEP